MVGACSNATAGGCSCSRPLVCWGLTTARLDTLRLLFSSRPNASHFAEPYLAYIPHSRLITDEPRAVIQTAQDFDVLWLEWANHVTRRILRTHKPRAFVIVRVHDWEIRSRLVLQVNWRNVDLVWFVNQDARRDFNAIVPRPPRRQLVLHNALDLDEWPVVASGTKHIGVITANIQRRKRLERAVDLMRYLPTDYRMTIRTSPVAHHDSPDGPRQLADRATAVAGGRVTLNWRPFDVQTITERSDVVDFWRDKSHVICTSDHEGFCYSFAEGMACGAAGATLAWDWGRPADMYPPGIVHDTLQAMADAIVSSEPGPGWRDCVTPFDARVKARALLDHIAAFRRGSHA